MTAKRVTYPAGAAFALFAIWQVAAHVWLPKRWVIEPVAMAVEMFLVLTVVVAALALARHHEATADRRDALSDAMLRVLEQEVRPALAPLLAALEALAQRPPEEVGEPTRTLLQQAATQVATLLAMIDDLARLSEGPAVAAPCARSLPELLHHAAAPHRVVAAQKQVRLQVEAGEDAPWPCGDASAILRLLSSLMGAAVAAAPSGGEVRARAEREGGDLRFWASTRGPVCQGRAAAVSRDLAASCHYLAEALGGTAYYQPSDEGGVLSVLLPARENPDG